MCRLKLILLVLLSFVTNVGIYAQRASVTTDILKWSTLSPNLSVELLLSSRTTLNIEGSINPFAELGQTLRFTHAAISPEFRFWFKRPQHSHFIGANILTSIYNLRYKSESTEGRTLAAGVTYGYAFILRDRLSLTPTIGFGYGVVENFVDSSCEFKPMLTKFGVGLTYIIN